MRGFDMGSMIAGIGILIFVGLVLKNWSGANAILSTSFSGGTTLVHTLQNP